MVTTNALISDVTFGLGLLASFGQQVDIVGIYANGGQAATGAATGTPTSSIVNSILGATGPQAGFGQMFVNARPMRATIRETSKVMEHPVETGVTLADHHIINPVEIDLPMVVSAQFYATTYNEIRQAFINATALSVKTRVGVYQDMIIADMPHEEDAEMYDVITIGLHLKQVLYAISGTNPATGVSGGMLVNFQPANPLNSNTAANGLQQAAAIGGSLLTAGTAVASYANLGKFL